MAERWTAGWVVATAHGDSIDRRHAAGDRVAVVRAPASIAFGPDGVPVPGGARIELADAERTIGIAPHCVIVDSAGRPRLEARACECYRRIRGASLADSGRPSEPESRPAFKAVAAG